MKGLPSDVGDACDEGTSPKGQIYTQACCSFHSKRGGHRERRSAGPQRLAAPLQFALEAENFVKNSSFLSIASRMVS